MKRYLHIVEQIYPELKHGHNRFRLIETYTSIDGPRSRLTSQCFATLEEAVAEIERLTQ